MHILVTGYGPFGCFTVNPSAVVVDQLARQCQQQDNDHGNKWWADAGIDIQLVTRVLDVDYALALDCSNWACNELNVDFAIHIGVYPGDGVVFLERRAFRDGYISKDVNGSVPLQNSCELAEGAECPPPSVVQSSAEVPSSSACRYTMLDLDRLKTALLDAQQRDNGTAVQIAISEDPGRFLCGYIYYCSLLNLAGRSLFVHIPPFDGQTHTADKITRLVRQLIVEVAKQISTHHQKNHNVGSGNKIIAMDPTNCPTPTPTTASDSADGTAPSPPSLSSLMINNGLTVSFPLGDRA